MHVHAFHGVCAVADFSHCTEGRITLPFVYVVHITMFCIGEKCIVAKSDLM